MRLCKFEIRNLKSIQDASFEWEDIVVLIGENNVGKSTVLQALQWFLSGSQIRDEALFRDNQVSEGHAIELIGHFGQLTAEEQQAPAVRGRMNRDLWIIKKRFWCEPGDDRDFDANWREHYYSYSSVETFANWPENDNSWPVFPPEYQELIAEIPARGPRPNQQTREHLRQLVRDRKPHLIGQTEPTWVPNPGGGGNWKSNANSIIPRFIFVEAVQDAADESLSKEASTYGKILSLIVEKQMMGRPEVIALRTQLDQVLRLFRPDPEHPENQAEEIRALQARVNERLNEVIGGVVSIETSEPDIRPVLIPSTTLVLRDREDGVRTKVRHQGHGLQRTLIMTLLQILADIQNEPPPGAAGDRVAFMPRATILAIEEPELYMHPQMARKMRDALFRLAALPNLQVISTTHSPVFLDMAQRHKSIVRVVKGPDRNVTFFQVIADLFGAAPAAAERDRLRLVARFHPTVNEVFFARRVVLLEEQSAIAAFERAAELIGIFERHPHVRRDVTLLDSDGKGNIPLFQRVLNHFLIPYTVIHDEDTGNPVAAAENATIGQLLEAPHGQNTRHMISPTNLEGLLAYAGDRDKVYRALKRVEELHAANALPPAFVEALNWIYFGQATEPVQAA